MAKKGKMDVGQAKAADQPKPQAAPVPAAGGLMGSLAALKKAGATAEAVKPSKSGVVRIDIPEDRQDVKAALKTYIYEDAKAKAADSRKKGPGEILREFLEDSWFKQVRGGQQYIKTLSLRGDINYGAGKLVVGKPNTEIVPPLTKELIDAGLQELFKTDYPKYVKSTLVLQIAEVTKGSLEPVLSKEDWEKYVLPNIPKEAPSGTDATVPIIQMLQDKLGNAFNVIFPSYDINIELRKDKPGDDGIVELKRDMALYPATQKKVEEGMAKGLLARWNGSLTSQKEALAAAQEELLALEKAVEEAKKNVANAQAAVAQKSA